MDAYQVTLGNVTRLNRRMNDGLTFLLVLRGRIYLEQNDKDCWLENNDLAVIDHNDIYSLNSDTSNIILMISISRQFLETNCPDITMSTYTCCSVQAPPLQKPLYKTLKKHVATMAYIHYKRETGCELLFQAELFHALHDLFLHFQNTKSEGLWTDDKNQKDDRMQAILTYIHKNYKNHISLEHIAKQEYMSVPYVSRLFRQKMGVNFLDYLNTLRLKSVVHDLIYTVDPITKVALGNGFASARSLNVQFKKVYNCSPHEYRRQNRRNLQDSSEERFIFLEEHDETSLETLVKFIDTHDRTAELPAQIPHQIDLSELQPISIQHFHNIIDIGDILLTLRVETRKQLEIIREQLTFDYVYFSIFSSGASNEFKDSLLLQYYDYFDIFSLFRQYTLIPFIRLDIAVVLHQTSFSDFNSALQWLKKLLTALRQKHDRTYFNSWCFEVLGTPEELRSYYHPICAALKDISPELTVGIRIPDQTYDRDTKLHTLRHCNDISDVHFLTFSYDPNTATAPGDALTYEKYFRTYHLNAISDLRELASQAGLKDIAYYLMDWNTLTGKSTVEAGEFHRTALITDTLLSLRGRIDGMSIRLNLYNQIHTDPEFMTYPLSLFLYRSIKRPAFFVYKALTNQKPDILYRNENILLTGDDGHKYALLIHNSCYISPFESLDNIRRNTYTRTFELQCTSLNPGRYRIKRFYLDKDNGSLYQSWVKVDFTMPLDEDDLDDYLENVSNPTVTLFEQEVSDQTVIRQTLTLNAVVLFVIKKIN